MSRTRFRTNLNRLILAQLLLHCKQKLREIYANHDMVALEVEKETQRKVQHSGPSH